MLFPILITAAVVIVTGLAAKFLVRFIPMDSMWNISWREFIAGVLLPLIFVLPAVFFIGKALSVDEALRYEEFYNGVETSTAMNAENCYPGTSGTSAFSGFSNCDHQYNTGISYSWEEVYYVSHTECDSDGKNCTTESERKTRTETAFIYNPYATVEYHYEITDSLGGSYTFPAAYVKDGEGYQGGDLPADLPRGDPQEWIDAKARLDAGNPRPVTRMFGYDNYILASQDELLKPFSKNVERYKEEEILPEHTQGILQNPMYGYNDSFASKVSFVDVEVADEAAWQESLMSFNAALGSSLRGDLHLVLIKDSLVESPTDYLNALKAYWLGEDFGRRAIAKNAIIVVAGVRGNTVEWGIASTGMPFGNEVMLQGIEANLPDTPLKPEEVIGSPRTVISPDSNDDGDDEVKVSLSETPGVLERVVLDDYPFKRACMTCSDDEGEIGYADLVNKIEPQPWQWGIMITVVGILALVWWYFAGIFDLFGWLRWPFSTNNRPEEDYEEEYPYDPYTGLTKKQLRKLRRLRSTSY